MSNLKRGLRILCDNRELSALWANDKQANYVGYKTHLITILSQVSSAHSDKKYFLFAQSNDANTIVLQNSVH